MPIHCGKFDCYCYCYCCNGSSYTNSYCIVVHNGFILTGLWIIIIKFSYNARSDRLKQCTLSEYRCTEELSRHRGNMADQFPSFSLGFSLDPDIFFDLENENENELLASVNLESPVGNSTNCTAIVHFLSSVVLKVLTTSGTRVQFEFHLTFSACGFVNLF